VLCSGGVVDNDGNDDGVVWYCKMQALIIMLLRYAAASCHKYA